VVHRRRGHGPSRALAADRARAAFTDRLLEAGGESPEKFFLSTVHGGGDSADAGFAYAVERLSAAG
jgi:hypothetical protein